MSVEGLNECAICLSVLDPRGGKQISSPGCCGKFFHQDCIDTMIRKGNKACPNCRQTIKTPSHITNHVPQSSQWFTFGGSSVVAGGAPPLGVRFNATQPQAVPQPVNSLWNPFTVFAPLTMQPSNPTHIAFGQQQQQQTTTTTATPRYFFADPHHVQTQPLQQPPQEVRRYSQSMRIQQQLPRTTTPDVFISLSFTRPLEEDILLSSDIEATSLQSRNISGSLPPMIVNCQPEKSELGMQGSDSFFVNVTFKSPLMDPSQPLHRTPIDLVCVLDNSGSMSGAKLNGVKQAMQFIGTQLTSRDRLSIVTFNSTATTLHGLKKMTPENKVILDNVLSQVNATGGTNIYSGLDAAFQILFGRKTAHRVTSVFLLTDGQDSQNGDSKTELCRRMRALGYSLFAFGFGADHDAEQLKFLTDVSEGTFTYVEANESVAEAFGGALGGQQSIVATDVKLSISMAPLSGCSIAKSYTGKYASQTTSDQQRINVTFANIYAGEARDILLQVRVPAAQSLRFADKFHVLSATAAYKQLDGTSMTAVADHSSPYYDPLGSTIAHCCVKRVQTEMPITAIMNVEVDAQKNRVMFLEATETAKNLASHRDMESARQQVRSVRAQIESSGSCAAGHAVTLSLLEDLVEVDRGLTSTQVFERGGLSSMHDMTSDYTFQRSSRTKASKTCQTPYQCNSSVAGQVSARTFCSPKADPGGI